MNFAKFTAIARSAFVLLSGLISVFIYQSLLQADTIYLKNGRSIEGLIKSEEGEVVDLEVCAGSVKFKKSEIERIEKSSPEEIDAMRQEWARHDKEVQDNMLKQQIAEERKPRKVEFSQDRHTIVLAVTLNKRIEVSLVLDTGASLVVLKKNIAEKLGINLDNVKPDAKLILADGRQVDAKYVTLESVKAQGVEAQNVEAAIMLQDVGEAGLQDGLLGMSFLRKFNFKVDYRDKKLILEKL